MEQLTSRKGFPLDLRPPRRDDLAFDASNAVFGPKLVERVCGSHHRAAVDLDTLRDDFLQYNAPRVLKHESDAYKMALHSVRREYLPKEKIIPGTLGYAEQHPDLPKDRSPGLPFNQQGYKTKGDCIESPEVRKTWHVLWDNIGRGRQTHLPDTALFFRAQICDLSENKIRATWGYPISVFIEEVRFFYPYMEWLKQNLESTSIAYGIEVARGGMSFIDEMVNSFPHSYYMCGDWSRFDKTIPAWLIRDAFSILADAFDFTRVQDSEGKVWRVRPELSIRRFWRLVKYFIDTPCRLTDGTRYRKSSGVPSGSAFTNLIDSIINAIVMRYLIFETTGFLPQADIYMGDDSIIVSQVCPNFEDIARLALEVFGMRLNIKKSYITQKPYNVHFLGYFNHFGLPIKANDFLIASFIFPERTIDEPLKTAARALGQMWSTLHPQSAKTWYRVLEYILDHHALDPSELASYVAEHTYAFKYLKTIGFSLDEITLPNAIFLDGIQRIHPPRYCERKFRISNLNVAHIWDSLIAENIQEHPELSSFDFLHDDDPSDYS